MSWFQRLQRLIFWSVDLIALGGKDYGKAVTFITDKFLALNENPKKHIYVHETCATDTNQIKVVFNIVKDVILHQVLNQTGIGF